jgi:hypothetical protein
VPLRSRRIHQQFQWIVSAILLETAAPAADCAQLGIFCRSAGKIYALTEREKSVSAYPGRDMRQHMTPERVPLPLKRHALSQVAEKTP